MGTTQAPPPLQPNTNQPRRKRTGCRKGCLVPVIGMLVLFIAFGFYSDHQRAKDMAQANTLWDAGDREGAVQVYVRELEFLHGAELSDAYRCIITHNYDSGNTEVATEYCNRAIEAGVNVTFTRGALTRFYDGARQAILSRREAEEAAKQAEEAARWAQQQAEEQRQAEIRAANTPNEKQVYTFYEVVRATGRHRVIGGVNPAPYDGAWRLNITVNDAWYRLSKDERLDYARTFRGAWAGVFAPDKASIKILDSAGNTIGEGTWSENAVWVD
ncbi:MAG: hypothetical protein H6922_00020 [Pseudomonadaceae bacterium]|nr:hypothetical protein [Pseudomonadaceae bacterium]